VQEIADTRKKALAVTTHGTEAVWQQVATAQKAAPKKPTYTAYLGRYQDVWLGDVNLFVQHHQLWLRAKRSPRLVGQLLPYQGTTYVVRWRDRTFNADAFATFSLDDKGRAASLKLKPISAATDFSYDFQDLDLQRVSETATVK
jgi:hypothetical protein